MLVKHIRLNIFLDSFDFEFSIQNFDTLKARDFDSKPINDRLSKTETGSLEQRRVKCRPLWVRRQLVKKFA